MRLVLERVPDDPQMPGLAVRVLAVNDSFEAVRLDRRLLIGPNVVGGPPRPASAEPALAEERENVVVLPPWGIYGRQRSFEGLVGRVKCHAYLLAEDSGGDLAADGPVDETQLALAAEPLVLDLI